MYVTFETCIVFQIDNGAIEDSHSHFCSWLTFYKNYDIPAYNMASEYNYSPPLCSPFNISNLYFP